MRARAFAGSYMIDTFVNVDVLRMLAAPELTTSPAVTVLGIVTLAEPMVVQVMPSVERWAVKVLLLRMSRR